MNHRIERDGAVKKSAKTYVVYSSNNSGGRWWLTDDNWRDLEKAGWEVSWFSKETDRIFSADKDGRWLGALAFKATRRGVNSLREAAAEWERITKRSSTDAGCACCGQPHTFTLYKNGKYTESGPDARYEASWD